MLIEPHSKALARLADLKGKAPGLRRLITTFKGEAQKASALDAPIDYRNAQQLRDKLLDMQSTTQLLIYNLEALLRTERT